MQNEPCTELMSVLEKATAVLQVGRMDSRSRGQQVCGGLGFRGDPDLHMRLFEFKLNETLKFSSSVSLAIFQLLNSHRSQCLLAWTVRVKHFHHHRKLS